MVSVEGAAFNDIKVAPVVCALSVTKGEASLTHRTVAGPSFAEGTRGILSYDVWREKVYQPGTLELIGNTVQQDFVDFDWGIQDWGVYRWAVTVNYDANQVSPPTFSNTLDKDMYTTVDVAVTLNSGDSPAGTQVTFTNTSEPALELVYDETLGASGQFTWDMFRRGVYDIEVFKAGYTSVSLSGVEIFDEASFEWLLDEILAPPTGLYVTPTGLARWMGGSSLPFTPFMETFDAGEIPAGWMVEAGTGANATGANWAIAQPTTARPFTNTPYMKVDSDAGPSTGLTHSLLYTPVIDASNAATLYLEFDQYYNYFSNEYADVEVYDGTDWVVVLHQVADIGSWTVPNHQVIDVSAYANAAFQVRFNYYAPGWKWYWSIDNVALNEVVTRGADRSFVNYKVFHDGVLVAEVEDSQYQYGTNGEALVDGETYLAEVATVYSTGQSARAAYTWTYIACDNYAVPGSFTAAQVEGTLDVAINWTIPTIPVGEDQIDFARITRDGEVIAEVATAGYLDEDLALGTYEYCITFVYESGAETCPATLCETVDVTGGAFVNGNVKEAAYLGGNNIAGASVVLTNDDDNSIVFSFVTDASGNYSGEVLAGTYNYEVTAEGYITATLEGVSVPTTATVTRNFELMEFPAPVELVVATELSDAAVQVTWRTPGTILFEPTTENFNNGMPADWTIVSGGTTADTWELVTSYGGSTLDGTPFMIVDSDGAGIGSILDEMLYSPVINTLGAEELYLEFDQYYRHLGTGSYGNVDVFDGTDWVNVLSQTATAGAWSAPNMQSIDVTAYANPQFQVRFHYFDNGAWAWYWALDNVTLTDQTSTRALALAPQSTLAGYNVYRTTCAEGGDLQFLGYTLDTTFNDNTWVSAEAGVYRWAVEAVYAQNESELRFSNCLDKDMITQVSVAVSTNSLDSPEGTDVMFTNTSEPDLALVYSTELDASGVYTWEEFRKGTYDIYVEKNGFAPISITGYVIDGPEAFVWVLEELLLPVSDLHVSPTGFATWRPGGVIPFEPYAFDFEADAQGWDIQGNVNGWQWGNNTSLSSSFMNFNGNDTHFLAVNADAAGSGGASIVAMATSPVMNLENADEVFVSFDYKLRSDALSVHYSIDGGAPVLLEDLAEYYSAGWTNHVIALPEEALVNNVQLIFLYEESGTWSYGGAFDNVSVSDVAPENARSLVNYKVWLDGVFATDTENTYWQYDPSNLVPGQEYFSEVAAVYTNGISAKMNYTWTYFPCDSFPGPADVTAEVENVNDVVISWGGNTPPPPGGEFFEDFEAGTLPTGWVVYDVDGDGFKWDNSALEFDVFDAHSGAYCMTSASYRNDVGALTPNNWLVTPAIAVTAGSQLSFWVDAQDPAWSAEQYYVKVSTTGNAVADFTTTLHSAVSPADWAEVVLDLSAYAGETVYIAFQHANVTDQFFIKIDDVKVTNTASRAAHTSPLAAGLSRAIPFKTQGLSQSEIDARINHTGAYAIVNVSENTFVANNVVNVAGDSKPLSSNRALLYDNGPLVNSPGTGVGGADESILQNVTLGMTTLGAGIQFASGNHMADDFVVDANWTIDQFTFYGYQTGSTTTSTMTGGYLQIYNGNPSTGGTVVWGDMTTNRMSSTTFSNIYRLSEGTPGTNRPIMEIVCETPGLTLTPGTYWVEYTLDGSLTSGPWAPPITITGETTTGNALQYLPASGWQPFQDGGTLTPQGLPFLIAGTANNGGGGSTTFDPGEYLGANVYRDGVLIAEMVQGETYTDEAVDPGYYDYCVTFVYTDGAESCLSSCVLDVLVTEDCEAPQNLTATLVEENNEVTLVWNENIAQEFRYDDGVATGQLGFTGGTTSSVLGAKHNTSAEITEVSWYLTSEGGPHSTVQIYIFGLDGSGLPNGSNVLYTASVSNTDDTWNTYTLPAPVAATGGFFLGVGYNGFAALGTDDGAGAPWVFQNNTHYFVSDYSAGGWATWESVGFAVNGMIRAIGVAGATASYAVNNEAPVVVNDKSQMSMVYTRLAQPATTGEPQWTQDARSADRAFMGYNIYKDGQLLEALWPETTYVYLEPNAGNTCYTVTAEYEFCGETEPSNEACVDIITDVENTDLSKISMYPNPSNSVVNIELTNDVSQVVVYNYVGQVVYELNVVKTKRIELNVRNYESGAYLVKFVTNAGDSFTKKMVVTK
ncbi:MAG: choice-of-anchor J domain-containing protein [Lentimicrobium sp.]|nr:choice-of-anchor J domain-containing protein [Lentimicrobium sp.]